MTTIYLIRHSKARKKNFWRLFLSPLRQNEMQKLCDEGINIAKEKLDSKELDEVDRIYSSCYTRTFQTSLILAKRLNIKVKKDKRFGERIHGVRKSYDELPRDFEMIQFRDENYKLPNGESQREVKARMLEAINDILDLDKDHVVAVFTHSTAIAFLLKNWCNIPDNTKYEFNNSIFFDGNWDYCETFKLEFNDNKELVSIKNIKY